MSMSMRNQADIAQTLLDNEGDIYASIDDKSCYWPGYSALHFAAEFQCLETVELLVKSGADITAKNTQGLTPLHLAFRTKNDSIIDLILSVHTHISVNPVNLEGLSHFHIACTRDDPKIVDNFLKWGADVNLEIPKCKFEISSTPYRPLRFAIEYQCTNVIKLLLSYNPVISRCILDQVYSTSNVIISNLIYSKIKQKTKHPVEKESSLSSLHVACINNDVSTVKNLLKDHIRDNSCLSINLPTWLGHTPLHLAVQKQNRDIARLLVDNGADITARDLQGKTALHIAFSKYFMVDSIWSAYSTVNENLVDGTGLSHFHIACTRDNVSIIENFLQNGVDVNSRVGSKSVRWAGYTALHFACSYLQLEVVDLLLEYGADVRSVNELGFTPLGSVFYGNDLVCKKNKFIPICDSLLSAAEEIGINDNTGLSRLHLVCTRNIPDGVKHYYTSELINQPVHLPDWLGRTPLHFAAYFDCPDNIELLLDLGADPTIEYARGYTALTLAQCHTYDSTSQMFKAPEKLLQYEGNVNSDAALLNFQIACNTSDEKAIEYFLKRGIDVNTLFNVCPDETLTPFQVVLYNDIIEEHNIPAIKLLLRYGADVNKANPRMDTPLHMAVEHNEDPDLIKLLLEHGADVNLQNIDGDTPVHLAIKNDACLEKIVALLESGTDMDIENNEGKTFLTCLSPDNISEPQRPSSEYIYQLTLSLIRHVKKLQFIHFHVSDKNKQHCRILLDKYHVGGVYYFVEAEFANACRNELDFMKTFKLDHYTTLWDILFKEPDKMAVHAENAEFRQILESDDFRDKFPMYGSVLKLQLRTGLLRKSFLEPSRASMRLLSDIKLPDSCYEHVIQYFSNEELDSFIKVFHKEQHKHNKL